MWPEALEKTRAGAPKPPSNVEGRKKKKIDFIRSIDSGSCPNGCFQVARAPTPCTTNKGSIEGFVRGSGLSHRLIYHRR
ncbi:hypothetical protein TNCV_5061921 [Trichonephila clavipes]|nr:hypothetical protein TNCV_5061921 [Trichonephila clavipes]